MPRLVSIVEQSNHATGICTVRLGILDLELCMLTHCKLREKRDKEDKPRNPACTKEATCSVQVRLRLVPAILTKVGTGVWPRATKTVEIQCQWAEGPCALVACTVVCLQHMSWRCLVIRCSVSTLGVLLSKTRDARNGKQVLYSNRPDKTLRRMERTQITGISLEV